MYMLSPIRQNTLNFLIWNEEDGVWFKVESLRLKAGGRRGVRAKFSVLKSIGF